jgi:hypothetical protein
MLFQKDSFSLKLNFCSELDFDVHDTMTHELCRKLEL